MSDEDDEDTGYCKPPKKSQWKKGQSGNPKGRPKDSENFETIAKRVLQAPVTVKENGKKRRIPTQEAIMIRTAQRAMEGDPRHTKIAIDIAQSLNRSPGAEQGSLSPNDEDILRRALEEFQKRSDDKEGGE